MQLSKDSKDLKLSRRQRTRYAGKFVAVLDNQIIASGSTYVDARYKLRKKLEDSPILRRKVQFHFIERRSTYFRGFVLALFAFFAINYQLLDIISQLEFLHQRIAMLILIDLAIFAVFFSSITMIDPVIHSRISIGYLGKALNNQERQLGWEVVSTGVIMFIWLSSIVSILYVNLEYDVVLRSTSYIPYLILFLFVIQLWYSIKEERSLKKLHNYLIDQITLDDRLSYDEIINYVSEIPQKTRLNIDRETLYATLEASLESPFALTKVIAFRILFRDLGIILGSIIISFGIGYILFLTDVISNLTGARIFGSFMTAGLLLFYALIKQSTSKYFAKNFVEINPTFTLRPGDLDRIYLKLFPTEVTRMKEETVITILMQSVSLTAGLGVASLIYGLSLLFLIIYNFESSTIDLLNSLIISIGMVILFLFILAVARGGTKKWVSTVEKGILNLDELIQANLGMTPMEIMEYLRIASKNREQILYSSSSDDSVR